MTQAPYSWTFGGTCPSSGSPIYGRVRKPGAKPATWAQERVDQETGAMQADEPEARRTCPPACPYGKPAA